MVGKPIRVLAVVYRLIPGGLENRLMDIIRNIDTSRVVIDVFSYHPEAGIYDEEVKRFGGRVFYNPPLNVKNMLWYVRYFKRFLEAHPEYRIVHAHQDAWCSVFCKGAYLAGVPVRIAHSRTALASNSLTNFIKNINKLPTKRYDNYLFAVSEKAGRWLYGDKAFDAGRVEIWPNSIEARRFYYDPAVREAVRAENNWNGKYVVMHVGNFTLPKNHPFILEVFSRVRERDRDALLVLVGDGDRARINGLIESNGCGDAVQLLGTRTDVNRLLQGGDVFLFPSIYEGLPGALVEAQAAGLPCVISDTIAREVHITPNLKILSLSAKATDWADSILKYKDFERSDTRRYIEEKRFDVRGLAKDLCRFYEDAYRQSPND